MHDLKNHLGASCDTDALNALLRGELSAVETYEQAMEKFEDQHILTDLQKIHEQHAHAAQALRERVAHFGGEPSAGSGPWGAFAAAITGTAKVIGPATALCALRQGEEHGINEYEGALKNEEVDSECKEIIRSDLLPKSRWHVEELNRLMGGM